MEENYYLIAFNSTQHAISTEQLLKGEGKEIMMIPTPREITSSCGLSLRFNRKDMNFVLNKLENNDISFYGIYGVEIGQKKKIIREISKGDR